MHFKFELYTLSFESSQNSHSITAVLMFFSTIILKKLATVFFVGPFKKSIPVFKSNKDK